LFLHADGSLTFTAPAATEKAALRTFVSDPATPVPYRPRPISPTYPGGDWRNWESGDQRFVDHRPDVLSYVSAPLVDNLVVTGPVAAEIFASTSGTDSDFIVKLIDVSPENEQASPGSEEEGPAPGQFAQSPNGYELPIAMEIRRGRYLDSFEQPKALVPNKPRRWDVPLRDRDHVFLKGHRIMVQIQSTWFPLIDRNPQTFVPNIAKARAAAYVAATQKVYASPDMASRIILSVVPNAR
jgi:putative CocE/NonD family hydrolase